MSAKNRLQEYCVKNGHTHPVYSTKRCGGEDHDPRFESTVCTGMRIYHGPILSSKRAAEQSAAELCYADLVTEQKKDLEVIHLKHQVIVFLDMENKPNVAAEILRSTQTTNIQFVGYASSSSSTLKKTHEIKDYRFTVIEVPTNQPDSTDLAIVLRIGSLIGCGHNANFVIVSGDHFAETTADLINRMHSRYKCQTCISSQSLLQILKDHTISSNNNSVVDK